MVLALAQHNMHSTLHSSQRIPSKSTKCSLISARHFPSPVVNFGVSQHPRLWRVKLNFVSWSLSERHRHNGRVFLIGGFTIWLIYSSYALARCATSIYLYTFTSFEPYHEVCRGRRSGLQNTIHDDPARSWANTTKCDAIGESCMGLSNIELRSMRS